MVPADAPAFPSSGAGPFVRSSLVLKMPKDTLENVLSRNEKDRREMLLIASIYGDGLGLIEAPRYWLVFRRGMPKSPIRVDKHTYDEKKAREHFDKLVEKMRQGCVGLVNPQQEIVDYASAPMVRTRW